MSDTENVSNGNAVVNSEASASACNVESSTDLVCLSSMKVLIVCYYFIASCIAFKMNIIVLFMSNDDLFLNLKIKWKKYNIFKLFNFQHISEETGKNHFNVFTQTSLNQCVSHWMFSNYMPGYIHTYLYWILQFVNINLLK